MTLDVYHRPIKQQNNNNNNICNHILAKLKKCHPFRKRKHEMTAVSVSDKHSYMEAFQTKTNGTHKYSIRFICLGVSHDRAFVLSLCKSSGLSCSKLTMSLVNISLNFQTNIWKMPKIFVEKMWKAFALQKLFTFFHKKYRCICL